MRRERSYAWLASGLILAHGLLGFWSASTHSATYDEPALLAAGLSFWRTGDFRMDSSDPPLGLLWTSAPAAAARPRLPLDGPEWRGGFTYAFGELALYWSGNDADRLLLSARLANLLLSAAFALFLWIWLRRRWGGGPACAALALYVFSPTVLAHASLATADFPAACAAGLAALALADFCERPRRGAALTFAACAAAACLCKYAAVLLWPAAVLCLLAGPDRVRRLRLFLLWAGLPAVVLAAAGGAAFPRLREGLLLRVDQAARGAHPTFLLGRVNDRGWPWYFAVAAVVKSSLPELAALAAVLIAASRRSKTDRSVAAFLAIMAAYFAAASFSRKQIGIRYILPGYVLLPAAAAPALAALWSRRRGPLLAACLGVWQLASALGTGPQWIAYFNEFAGGPAGGARWLADSNLDWGQDLRRLAAWSREAGGPPMILSYFGTASPEYYGLKPQHLRCTNAVQRRWMDPVDPPREVLAVSVTQLQQVYWRPPAIPPELADARPLARVGASILVYDVTHAPAVHRWLADAYAADGDAVLSAHERARAAR